MSPSSSPVDSGDLLKVEVPSQAEESLFCVFLCDFLFDVVKVPTECWSDEICNRAAAGLTKCRKAKEDSGEITLGRKDNVETVDLRGEHETAAIPIFLKHLHHNSLLAFAYGSKRYLKVIVGCLEHGVGEGKLKDEVLRWLLREKGIITWKLEYDGSLICIKLKGVNVLSFWTYEDY